MTATQGNAKVLIISLHHPELMRGGAQRIAYELFQGLQNEPGIEPVFLASTDRAYPALYKAGACITGFDQRPNEFLFLPAGIQRCLASDILSPSDRGLLRIS